MTYAISGYLTVCLAFSRQIVSEFVTSDRQFQKCLLLVDSFCNMQFGNIFIKYYLMPLTVSRFSGRVHHSLGPGPSPSLNGKG